MADTNTTASPDLTEPELLAHIRAEIERLGGIEAASEAWRIWRLLLQDILAGNASVSEDFLSTIGFERVTLYRRKQEATDG